MTSRWWRTLPTAFTCSITDERWPKASRAMFSNIHASSPPISARPQRRGDLNCSGSRWAAADLPRRQVKRWHAGRPAALRGFQSCLSEHDDAADDLTLTQRAKGLVDGVEAYALGDEFVQHQPPFQIGARQHGEITRGPGVAVARAADALLLHQRAPAETDLDVDVDLAEPDHLAAGPHRLDRGTKRGGAAGGLDHDVGAAAAAFLFGSGGHVLPLGIHAAGCAHAPCEIELAVVDVDRDDFRRAGKPCALHRSQPNRAAADHHHRIGVPDMGDIERRADARHHTAADQAGAIERDVRRDHDRLMLLHDAIFAEGADEHQMLELFAARAPRLRGAVELQRLRALAEIILAQDREAAVAIVAVAAMRVPRQDDVIALFHPPHGGTHLLDHACGFMAEHDRHRIAQRAVDHFEIGVAKPRGTHAHQHVRWGERRGSEHLDLQRAVRAVQHGRPVVEGHGRAQAISYFAFLTSPFFTPASGKTHIAATMNTAVAMTKIESSGRIGDPLQNASTAATISATAETAALTSVGTAIAFWSQLAPTGTAAASSGGRAAPRRFFFTNRVS